MNRRLTRVRIALVGGSQLIQKLVGFLIIAIMTRYFSRESLGEYFLAVAIGTIAAQATELGTSRYLIRAVARRPPDAMEQLSQVLSLRLPLMLLAYLLVNAACLIVRPSLAATLLVVTLYLLLLDLQYTFAAFFVGLERYRLRTAMEVAGQVVLAALTLGLASRGGGLRTLLWAYVGAYALVLVVTALVVRRRYGWPPMGWSRGSAWAVARQSLPIFGVTLLDAIHARADTVMLGFLRPLPEVAAYAAAYRLLEVSRLGIRPVALIFFPICVALAARQDWSGLRALFGRLARTSLAVGAVAALLVILTADLVVRIVFGPGYDDAVPLVRTLFLGTPMLFTGLLAVALIHALHLERSAIRAGAWCVAANVLLNAAAIPLWGSLGAAVVTLATQALWTVWLASLVLCHLDAWLPGAEEDPSAYALEEAKMESVE
ncbi:MAG TPA: oligosaccharide flippase family protein [Gemmatimonadales bacterium]|nr:oligosaccharide flippase family protein [Gemmatimonadales bacterium]